ncbi:uncharacterized protein METZ01_LOCUS507632, partial [marine metagenome]
MRSKLQWLTYTLGALVALSHAGSPDKSDPIDILEASIEQLQAAQDAGKITASDLVGFYLDRIARYDQTAVSLNSIQALNPEAQAQAVALDTERANQGARSLLHGIPVLVKDNYETIGMPTTAGSVLFQGF